MNLLIQKVASGLLIIIPALASTPVWAVSHPYDFHADARMVYENNDPVDKAYGYMNVITDNSGKGFINVMFSNGSSINLARFNARVKFLNAAGSVIKEEYFAHRISAAMTSGAIERKVTKPLPVSNFDSIQVDFFLSEVPD
ncbi:MAG: hypothetical protein GY763_09805 [Gammaproteobacteria bacterium]|nr:hypothetical protein [Gammaproteobacteria bacterium]